MLIRTRGIVFRTIKYGETSVIADVFTEQEGLHTFVAGGVRKAKSNMPFNLFQSMSVVELVAYFKDNTDAPKRLKELQADLLFQHIPFDIKRGAVLLFMAEICRKSIQEAEANKPLFDFLIEKLELLDNEATEIVNMPAVFLLQLSAYLGFQPEPPENEAQSFFDMREGIFLEQNPGHGAALDPPLSKILSQLLTSSDEMVLNINIPRAQRKRLLQALLQYYGWHVSGFGKVNTPEVMEWVWS